MKFVTFPNSMYKNPLINVEIEIRKKKKLADKNIESQ